jgi:hypothetical protein
VKKQKVRTWRAVAIKIYILFYGDRSWTVTLMPAVRQMEFGTVKNHGHTYKFNLDN